MGLVQLEKIKEKTLKELDLSILLNQKEKASKLNHRLNLIDKQIKLIKKVT
jgi:hypothetical protein